MTVEDPWSGSHWQEIQLVEDHRHLQLTVQGTTKLSPVSGVISSQWPSVIFKHGETFPGAYQSSKRTYSSILSRERCNFVVVHSRLRGVFLHELGLSPSKPIKAQEIP